MTSFCELEELSWINVLFPGVSYTFRLGPLSGVFSQVW